MLWVDLAKAFDSVSRDAIKWSLSQWGMPCAIRRLLSTTTSKQSVSYVGNQDGKTVRSAPLEIRNGLKQGDTPSPLPGHRTHIGLAAPQRDAIPIPNPYLCRAWSRR